MSSDSQTRNSRFELRAWFYMRISAVLLLLLALWHAAIMHVVNDISQVDYDFVVARWSTPLWRSYDFLLLTFALTHGTNGMRTVIDDYIRSPRTRLLVQSGLIVISFVVLVVGAIILFTFEPV